MKTKTYEDLINSNIKEQTAEGKIKEDLKESGEFRTIVNSEGKSWRDTNKVSIKCYLNIDGEIRKFEGIANLKGVI